MKMLRSVIALDPRLFGRGPQFSLDSAPGARRPDMAADLKLFATTFVGGFLFMAIYLI